MKRGILTVFAVLNIFKGPDDVLWLIKKEMERALPPENFGYQVGIFCVIMQLGYYIRKAGASHVCDTFSTQLNRKLYVDHSATVCGDGIYYLWKRREGIHHT